LDTSLGFAAVAAFMPRADAKMDMIAASVTLIMKSVNARKKLLVSTMAAAMFHSQDL